MVRTQAVTILFCDLVASTERRARLGDDAFDEFSTRFMAVLRAAIVGADGREVSSAGDGLMVVFSASVADAVACATTMHRSVAELDPQDPPLLRIGISCGEVAQDGADFSGMPIVEAARLEAAAAPGKTFASSVVRSLVGTRRAFRFRTVGDLTLKGLPAPLATVEVIDDEVADVPIPMPTPRPPTTRRLAPWQLVVGIVAVVLFAAVVLLVISNQGSNEAGAQRGIPTAKGYSPRFEAKPCPADFLDQVRNGTCGDLVVPEDRSKPKGRWIRLPITRAPALSGNGHADPTIAIGGFGGVTVEDLAKSPARDHADLITIATRVTESAGPGMGCPDFEPIGRELMGKPQDDPAVLAAGQVVLRACYEQLTKAGVALSRYTLDDASDDVLDLMRALRLRRVNLSASGDDAISAYAVVREAPGAVRTLTLDAPDAPGTSLYSDPTGQLAAAFDQYADLCRANTNCARAYPDLAAIYRNNWQQADPTLVRVTIPGEDQLDVLVDGNRGAKALANALADTRTEASIAAGIAQPPSDVVALIAADFDYFFHQPRYPWARSLSSWCSYNRHTVSPASIVASRTRPELAGVDDGSLNWLCAAWPVPKISASAFTSVATDIPTMIVEGALNPFVSPQWASTLQAGLKNAVILSFPTLGARLFQWGPPCLNDLRRMFLATPSKRLDTKPCTRQSPPINFVTGTT